MARGLRGLFWPHYDLSASSLTPLPLLDTRIPWTKKLENKDAKRLPSPLPSPYRMHSYSSQKWSNDDHIWTFLFEKRKKKIQHPLLKFSIKIHICIIIYFKAIRGEWAEHGKRSTLLPVSPWQGWRGFLWESSEESMEPGALRNWWRWPLVFTCCFSGHREWGEEVESLK